MKFAICALGWNKAEVTRAWLDSVKATIGGQTVGLYLMDNGSTDGGATTRCMLDAQPAVFIRNDENESIYRGWNRLEAKARMHGADAVIFSNNDLVCHPGWLDAMARELAKNEKRYFLPNGSPTIGIGTIPARAGWCLVLPKEAVEIALPIPEELQLWYGDDWIHYKLGKAGYRCEAVLDSMVHHIGSVSFYSREGYTDIVKRDREAFIRLTNGEVPV